MDLLAVPAFADNYIWTLHNGRDAVVVDPGDAQPVLRTLDSLGLRLRGILVTHHHGDHVGGVAELSSRLEGPVHGPARERLPVAVSPVRDGDVVELLGLRFEVIDVPGHTAGHVAYFCPDMDGQPVLFCGDTLFSAGCGRLFEGTPQQMHASLSRLASLPGTTRVCCTHEYTLSNLRFAQTVDPANQALVRYAAHCIALREAGEPTLPSSIALEREVNPFLRCSEPAVIAAARQQGAAADAPVAVFAALRAWKDVFR